MQRSLPALVGPTRTTIGARLLSSTRSRPSPPPSSSPSSPPSPPSGAPPSHYLVTLQRSPLHLEPAVKQSLASLGLYKRLSSSIVPVSPTNEGYILRAKELVQIRPLSRDQVAQLGSEQWRNRPGQGRQGSGLRVRHGAGEGGVIRVGSERARGDERGFKVVN